MRIESLHPCTVGSVTVVQGVLRNGDPLDFQTSAGAINSGEVEVCEMSDSGVVNCLRVRNKSERPVFFSDGDILQGAKQNRVLNVSLLLAPRSECLVPVSCIEQGRWRQVSARFGSSQHVASSQLRGVKAQMLYQYSNASDMALHTVQAGVWGKVAADHDKLGEHTLTSSMSEVYDRKQTEMDAQARSVQHVQDANAVAVFIGDKLVSLDIFARADVLEEYLPKITRGALIDAYGSGACTPAADTVEAAVWEAVDQALTLEETSKPSVSLGREKRFRAGRNTGFRLEYEGKLVHASLLCME